MIFTFTPLGMPFSSSYSVSASFASTTSLDGFPTTASLAEYVIDYVGPPGPPYVTASAQLI